MTKDTLPLSTKRLPPVTIACSERDARDLLHLVVGRSCEINRNWSRKANAERKRLEALRSKLEDALIEWMKAS
jgi:hypothetical protein